MILVFTEKMTPRKKYVFHQVLTRILGIKVKITCKIEEFIASNDLKFSYVKARMGNEFFVKCGGLLEKQGVFEQDIRVRPWDDTFCFYEVGEDSDIPFDIFSAAFYMLTRYEEFLPHQKDKMGRFPAKESLAYKNDFLKQPVVDIWAYKFKEALLKHYPEMKFPERKSSTLNLLAVSEVYKYRKKGFMRNFGGGMRDLLHLRFKDVFERMRTQLFWAKDPYDIYKDLLQFSRQHKIEWYYMFQLSDYSRNNKNIDHHRISYQSLIKSMGDYGKTGLLLGYEALFDLDVLKREKKRFENIANRELEMAITNDHSLNLPDLYNNYDALEIGHDYSMGFVDRIGFRAGTCTPYLYYELNLERISPLVIHPSAFNSEAFRPSSYFEVRTVLDKVKASVKSVNGQLLMVFKNIDFADEKRKEKFLQILERMNEDGSN